jgi:DNA-binding NarL/FixJ family response regulator
VLDRVREAFLQDADGAVFGAGGKREAGRRRCDTDRQAIQQRLVAAMLDRAQPPPTEPASMPRHELPDELTPREVEVLKLIAAGLSNREIADALVLSSATVKTHVNRIFHKTGARDRAQAVRYAYQHGLA